jgi:hypothetical protein
MSNGLTRPGRIYLGVVTVVGWFALVAQFVLMMDNRLAPVGESVVRFFSYFTILSNILVTVAATVLVISPASRRGKWLARASPQTALAVYIAVVCLVYNLVLRPVWDPQGLQRVVDELLHVVVPVLYILYWLVRTQKSALRWRNIPGWLIYPAVYALWILLWGELTAWYPYPFMDVGKLGYGEVLENSGLVVLVFLMFSLLPVAAGKVAGRRARR